MLKFLNYWLNWSFSFYSWENEFRRCDIIVQLTRICRGETRASPPLSTLTLLPVPRWQSDLVKDTSTTLGDDPSARHILNKAIECLHMYTQLYKPNSFTNILTISSALLTHGFKKVVKEIDLHRISVSEEFQSFWFSNASSSTRSHYLISMSSSMKMYPVRIKNS